MKEENGLAYLNVDFYGNFVQTLSKFKQNKSLQQLPGYKHRIIWRTRAEIEDDFQYHATFYSNKVFC